MSATEGRDEPTMYVHGYDLVSPPSDEENQETEEVERDWVAEYEASRIGVEASLGCRDVRSLLARSASQCLVENVMAPKDDPTVKLPAMEMLQAIALRLTSTSPLVPPSPNALVRMWSDTDNMLHSFMQKQNPARTASRDAYAELGFRSKIHTLNYRFSYDRDACLRIIGQVAGLYDISTGQSDRLKDRYVALVELLDSCVDRLGKHYARVHTLQEATSTQEVLSEVAFFCEKSQMAQRAWRRVNADKYSIEMLRSMAFQLAEIGHDWIYTFANAELSDLNRDTLAKLAIQGGNLCGSEFEHLFMNNPVWSKPFIQDSHDEYFTAIPHAAMAFPFKILEALIPDTKASKKVLSDARAEALETLVFDIVSEAMPSARVYRSVIWTDPQDGTQYENDVVAILGNQIYVFEAKSGKIAEAARRGAKNSLKLSLERLFVEPAIQSARLQDYLNRANKSVSLVEKETGKQVELELNRPKAVYRFGVTMESLANLTSSKRYLVGLGLFDADSPWAPSLSIGELHMISKHLDNEVSFAHYLSRRFSIEEILDFMGDEQDLLSMYLTNGFCILGEETLSKTLMFVNSDQNVRVAKTPSENRENADVVGVQLPPRWKKISNEVYAGHPAIDANKFDILFTIMNQSPPSLHHLQKRISRWQSGGGGSSKHGEHVRYQVGDRQYILMLNCMDQKAVMRTPDITSLCRQMAIQAGGESGFDGITDCVVITVMKKSSAITYDGVSFFRFLPRTFRRPGPTF